MTTPPTTTPSTVEPHAPEPAAPQTGIFIGPHGLRAGWGILIYLVIAAAISIGLIAALQYTLHPRSADSKVTSPIAFWINEFGTLFGVIAATWIMSKIESRPFGEYGLGGSRRRGMQFAQGFVLGFVTLSAVIGALYASHAIVFDGFALQGGAIWRYALIWLGGFLMVGFFEEMFFRGYLQYTLARGIGRGGWGFWIAAVLFNLAFGLAHRGNPGESPIGIFLAGFVGLVFCLSLWYTRSLWWAIGWHATWDWGESYFYGTADSGTHVRGHLYATHPQGALLLSGGPTGPEGSYYAALAVVLTAVIIWLTLRHEHNRSTCQALVNPVD